MENKNLTEERITDLYDKIERLEYEVVEIIKKQKKIEESTGLVWEEF
jgi:hypothetical protein